MEEPSTAAWAGVTSTVSLRRQCSSTTMAVMIFVVLATSIRASASFSYKTVPVSGSITMAEAAEQRYSAAAVTGSANIAAAKSSPAIRIFFRENTTLHRNRAVFMIAGK